MKTTHIHIHRPTKDSETTSYKGHTIVQEGTTWGPDGKTSVPQYIISGPSIKGRMSGFNSLEAAKARIDNGTRDAEPLTIKKIPDVIPYGPLKGQSRFLYQVNGIPPGFPDSGAPPKFGSEGEAKQFIANLEKKIAARATTAKNWRVEKMSKSGSWVVAKRNMTELEAKELAADLKDEHENARAVKDAAPRRDAIQITKQSTPNNLQWLHPDKPIENWLVSNLPPGIQMGNHIGGFPSKAAAEAYVAKVTSKQAEVKKDWRVEERDDPKGAWRVTKRGVSEQEAKDIAMEIQQEGGVRWQCARAVKGT